MTRPVPGSNGRPPPAATAAATCSGESFTTRSPRTSIAKILPSSRRPSFPPKPVPVVTPGRSTYAATISRKCASGVTISPLALRPVVEIRDLVDPLEHVVAVALRIEESRPGREDHHVRVEPDVHERRSVEHQLHDHALLGLLPEILAVLEVPGADVDEPWPVRRRVEIETA